MILDNTPCSRCGSHTPDNSCYVCGEEPEADEPQYHSRKDARMAGFKQLTVGYDLPQEQWMIDKAVADMSASHMLVEYQGLIEIWSKFEKP